MTVERHCKIEHVSDGEQKRLDSIERVSAKINPSLTRRPNTSSSRRSPRWPATARAADATPTLSRPAHGPAVVVIVVAKVGHGTQAVVVTGIQ